MTDVPYRKTPDHLLLAEVDVPQKWYESRFAVILLASFLGGLIASAELANHVNPDLTLRTFVALACLGGRFLDWHSTHQTLPVIEEANAVLPPEFQVIEAAGSIPDHPEHRDFFRWPVAVREGVVLGAAFSEPAIAVGIFIGSVCAALNNYRQAARAACVIAHEKHE